MFTENSHRHRRRLPPTFYQSPERNSRPSQFSSVGRLKNWRYWKNCTVTVVLTGKVSIRFHHGPIW
jgi:hypothetical protein